MPQLVSSSFHLFSLYSRVTASHPKIQFTFSTVSQNFYPSLRFIKLHQHSLDSAGIILAAGTDTPSLAAEPKCPRFELIRSIICSLIFCPSLGLKDLLVFFSSSQAHLWAFHTSALGPLAEDLAPAAGAELAARAVPHVPVVPHGAPVQAAPLGGGAFVAALTGALHFGLTLRGETTNSVRVY